MPGQEAWPLANETSAAKTYQHTRSITLSLTQSLTHSLSHSLPCSFNHSLTQLRTCLTHPHTHPLTHPLPLAELTSGSAAGRCSLSAGAAMTCLLTQQSGHVSHALHQPCCRAGRCCAFHIQQPTEVKEHHQAQKTGQNFVRCICKNTHQACRVCRYA